MSETPNQIDVDDFDCRTLPEYISEANQDSDPASFWFFGEHAGESIGGVMIVKGQEAAHKAYNLLCNHGLITPGKPVIDPKSTHPVEPGTDQQQGE